MHVADYSCKYTLNAFSIDLGLQWNEGHWKNKYILFEGMCLKNYWKLLRMELDSIIRHIIVKQNYLNSSFTVM